ncbi:Exo 5'-3' exonuclease (including N-terminal domain of PolI) [uncultured Caudovirales phage]|uniref:Exo 5'-3' exonuclease (Including N-terminal domain of PolI) n=1 Tax=uncultured Caudovirales phage TaxID=2100421 RepID=A0A6J5KUD4_9CAUD|nr:Exo 5'-3' exonuclease (including N-terminal domain of PolI) [uncultured Caudovirales phage]CAB5220571.1 Exo 5'-3' exonuclease (including N-terminal domain of PolI) [uncultured Caudovirales phage]
MKLLIDADILAYHAAYSKEGNTISGAIDKVDELMEKIFWDCQRYNQKRDYSAYLTGKGNFRNQISDVYKANRPTEKPQTLKLIKNWLVDKYNAVVVEGQEADDAIAIEATKLGYDEVIIVSVDKDFKQLPCMIFNYRKGTFFKADELGSQYNFWTQVLTGDTVDNIKGIYGIGPAKAMKILEGSVTNQEMYQAVLKAYGGNKESLTKTAQLVYLRRKEGEMWQPPVKENLND